MRGSRQFSKRIDFYKTTAVPDGFGGSTLGEEFLTSSWASVTNLKTNKAQQLINIGINDVLNTIEVIVRKRDDVAYNSIDQFIKYKGEKYVIQHISDYESTSAYSDSKLVLLATKQAENG